MQEPTLNARARCVANASGGDFPLLQTHAFGRSDLLVGDGNVRSRAVPTTLDWIRARKGPVAHLVGLVGRRLVRRALPATGRYIAAVPQLIHFVYGRIV